MVDLADGVAGIAGERIAARAGGVGRERDPVEEVHDPPDERSGEREQLGTEHDRLAVSGQIRKLEEHAGIALFEQVGKKTHLTAAGSDLLGIARSIIEQFEVAEHAMTQHKGVSGGRLNVSRGPCSPLPVPSPWRGNPGWQSF